MRKSDLPITSKERVAWLPLIALLLWLTAVLMLPSNPLENLPGQDNGVFLYGGQQILLGKIPYLDFWDHKGPLIHYLNALGLFLGRGLRWGVWSLEFIFLFLTALGIYQVAKNQWGVLAAFISLAGWAYGIYVVGGYHRFHDSNFTETYSLLFSVCSVYCWTLSRRIPKRYSYFLLIGGLAGFSFMLRPNNIGIQASLLLIELIFGIRSGRVKDSLIRIGYAITGSLGVLALFILYFLRSDALPGFIDSVFVYNYYYSQSGSSTTYEVVSGGIGLLDDTPLLGYIVIVIYIVWHWARLRNDPPGGAFLYLLIVGGIIESLLTSLSGRILVHYFITWIPYVSWSLGAVVFIVLPGRMRARFEMYRGWIVPTLVFLLFLGASRPSIIRYVQIAERLAFQQENGVQMTGVISNYVEAHTDPEDYVLVWGNEAWINFLSRRASPSKYFYQYPLFMRGYSDKEKVAFFLHDLAVRRPRFILEPIVNSDEISPLNIESREKYIALYGIPEGMDQVFYFIDANYCFKEKVHEDVTVYELKSEVPQGATCN